MASVNNWSDTLLLGAALFTLLLTGGCLSSGGSSGGGSSRVVSSSGGVSSSEDTSSSGNVSSLGNAGSITFASSFSSLVPVSLSSTPRVTRVNPEESSTGAVITAIVLAQFDREMDATTINSSTFTLTGPGGDVAGTVDCDSPCQTASFEPAAPLEIEETHTATLDETITDANGIPLALDVVWSFSTAPELVRASTDANGTGGIQASQNAATDQLGRFVAFDSTAENLVSGDGNGASDVFVKDTQTGEIERVSVGADGTEGDGPSLKPTISAAGRYVAFESGATNLLSSATPVAGIQIYLKDRETGDVTLVSADGSDSPGIRTDPAGNITNGISTDASISAEGRYVAFQSNATNLVTLPSVTAGIHVYVNDLNTGDIKLASADDSSNAGDANSTRPAISADGAFVAFQSASTVFGADGGLETQIFRKDLLTDDLLLVSATDGGDHGDGISANPTISSDGRFVAFQTAAPNLQGVTSPSAVQIFRKDTDASSDSLVIASADEAGDAGENDSLAPSISDDGRYVAFQSTAENLIGSSSLWVQLCVKDLQSGADGPIAVVSVDASVSPAELGEGDSLGAAMTRDGGYVAFESRAENLLIEDSNGVSDVFRGLNDTFPR